MPDPKTQVQPGEFWVKKDRLYTNRAQPQRPSKPFAKNAVGKNHKLPVIERPNRDPNAPRLVRCQGYRGKHANGTDISMNCGRIVTEDEVVPYDGQWVARGCCVANLERNRWLEDAKIDVEPS